jgi:hypothetical protein
MLPDMLPPNDPFKSNGDYLLLVLAHWAGCVLPFLAAVAYLYMLAGAVALGLSCRIVSTLTLWPMERRLDSLPKDVAWWFIALWPVLVPFYWLRLAGGTLWHLFIGLRLSHALDLAGLLRFLAGLGYERDGDGE